MPERNSIANTLVVAISLSLICSLLVASAAVMLKPLQAENAERYSRRIILDVAGLYETGADIDRLFESFEIRVVDLNDGSYVDESADTLEESANVAIPVELDLAQIHRRDRYATVYVLKENGVTDQVVLPVYGSGLWSTMHGYLAVDADGSTIRGLRFHEHGETPGLGDQIDDADWRALWPGKRIYDELGSPQIEVIRGSVPPGPGADYQVDGISGATLTGKGVTNLLRYWTGAHGYAPYLQRLREEFDATR